MSLESKPPSSEPVIFVIFKTVPSIYKIKIMVKEYHTAAQKAYFTGIACKARKKC